jgi:Zn-dependent peptidase ImmA (M78 family)/transcriptional regulator with XRE-family HTH domain
MSSTFNPEMLLLARQLRTLSQAEVADRSGVSQAQISKVEHGLSDPSSETVAKLANALGLPDSFFSQLDRLYGLPLSVHPPMFRRKRSVGQGELERITAELNLRLLHLRRLLRAVEIDVKPSVPHLDLDENDGPEGVARLLRRVWRLPAGPVASLTAAAEEAGIIVVPCEFGAASVDGVSLWVAGMPPCVFLNKHRPADRLRFSLAHEIGHLVMHQVPSTTMEDEADLFAGELLMPRTDIATQFGRVTLARLAEMKAHWRVAMQALLVTAHRVGALTSNQARYLWMQLGAAGYRLREPPETDFEPEKATVMRDVVLLHLERLGYSLSDLATAVHVSATEFASMYDLELPTKRPPLRLVR